MTSLKLTRGESAAVEAILEDDLSDPVQLIARAGLDKRTFFQHHTFSDLDFSRSNLKGVSFLGARLFRCRMTLEQAKAIDSTNPALIVDREILASPKHVPDNVSLRQEEDHKPRIIVFGIGGSGGNAVNHMIEKELDGVEFVVANTDVKALGVSRAPTRIQMGVKTTEGLGSGARPSVGSAAAKETIEEIIEHLARAHMCFITAGLGGGTGTGAAPIIAQAARELGLLTVGLVTKPFQFEGAKRMKQAEDGIEALQKVVDTLIIIPNQNLFRLANEGTTFTEAFAMADDVLYHCVKCVTDLMARPGLINLDFADVRAVMDEMGKAMTGTGEAEGDNRAIEAAEKAIANPLLDEMSLNGAKGVLINITGGYDLTLFELDEAANFIREKVGPDANIIAGSTLDESMEGRLRVSIVATGIVSEVTRSSHQSTESSTSNRPKMFSVEDRKKISAGPS